MLIVAKTEYMSSPSAAYGHSVNQYSQKYQCKKSLVYTIGGSILEAAYSFLALRILVVRHFAAFIEPLLHLHPHCTILAAVGKEDEELSVEYCLLRRN